MSNKLTINFKKTNAILFSNSLNAQNDCPDIFFKLGETTRKMELIKETDSVRFLGIWLDIKLKFNDYFKKINNGITFSLFATVKPLITNTSKEFIKCRILHFLIMECSKYLVF